MLEITKEFTFDTAHMLYGHDGLCKNIHGHTYKLLVTVGGETIKKGSSKEMLIDFKDLKAITKRLVVDKFDHAFMYDETNESESEIAAFLREREHKVVAIPGRSTCENLSKLFFYELCRRINLTKITLYETPTSYSVYKGNLNDL